MNTAALLMDSSPTKTLGMPACGEHLFPAKLPRRLALPFFLLCAVLLARPCAATPGEWEFTGSLNTARYQHTATLLQDGRVLVAGGYDSSSVRTTSAELYDPATGNWTMTGSLKVALAYHAAILLPSGKVLVAGGSNASGPERTAELYDPVSGTWSFTDHSVTYFGLNTNMVVLPDGQVLVVSDTIAELYDPASGTWRLTGAPIAKHGGGPIPLKLLPNGKVLYAGGLGIHSELTRTAELYDPASETWSLTGSLNTARGGSSAILLPSGLVLLAGGGEFGDPSSELYDPATGTWSYTGPTVTGYAVGEMNLLPTGMILSAAGTDAQLYDPATGTWSPTASLHDDHPSSRATLLPSGEVLVEGGGNSVQEVLASAELYDPGTITAATMASGRGSIAGRGDTATFNFRANLNGNRPSGSVTFSDPAAGIAISRAKVRTLTFTGTSADLTGNARLGDGTRVTYSLSVTDNSSDGSTDTFSISLSNGYSADGRLTSGDISVR